jgi:hypothetical protein
MATKTIITRKSDNVITNIVTATQVVENGLQVTDNIVGTYIIAGIENYNVYSNIETADAIVCEKYIYTVAGGFVDTSLVGKTLLEIQSIKISQMQDSYNQTIYNTFPSTAFDGKTEETYSCSATDQVRINGEVTVALTVKAGYSSEQLSWKNVNQDNCVTWTADQIIKLGGDLHKFVTDKTDYLESLIVYINKLTNIDDVNKVTWGMTIPTTSEFGN